jgi:TetR/AcrR family transcriptional regulator, regulator of autoinduction and epiphytic fitness
MRATAPTPGVDGRTARTRRTRAAIVDAHVALLAEGSLRPTADQIATRAGVSVRSLWIHFPDLEALFAATAAEVLARQDAAFRPVDPDLPLAARIEAFCRQRAAVLERVAPFARASILREPFSPALRDYRQRHVRRVIDEVQILFSAELSRVPEPDASVLRHAIAAAATWGHWASLRDDLGLTPGRSRAVMVRTVTSLLIDPHTPHEESR